MQELLSILNLKGAVITADAMHCQQKTATKIIDSDADYILQVKNNPPRLLKPIAKIFADHEATDFAAKQVRSSTIRERNRTREETRTCMVCPAPVALRCVALRKQWTGLKTIGRMDRTRVLSNRTIQTETSYFIGSLPPLARRHVSHLREHWSIEHTHTSPHSGCNICRRQQSPSQRQRAGNYLCLSTPGSIDFEGPHYGQRQRPRQTPHRWMEPG